MTKLHYKHFDYPKISCSPRGVHPGQEKIWTKKGKEKLNYSIVVNYIFSLSFSE